MASSAKAAALGPRVEGKQLTSGSTAMLYAADHPEHGTPLQLCSTVNEGQVAMQGQEALADHPHSSQERHVLVLLLHTTGDRAAETSPLLMLPRLARRSEEHTSELQSP